MHIIIYRINLNIIWFQKNSHKVKAIVFFLMKIGLNNPKDYYFWHYLNKW